MSDKKEIAISVKDLDKTFMLPHEQHSGLKQLLVSTLRRNRKKGYELQHVLKGLNFEIEKGDFFGIVGRNGSGKSTLLKTLAGIYTPDEGAVKMNGTLVPFIELGVGFNPELTGRENVFLNGALLGFSRDEMKTMYDEIVDFAELSKFMDQKLKNYSSGMQVRLAFSIAIRADADILLLDEVLAVGDEAFQRKCFSYFAELKKKKKTVILVTHSMDSVQQFCNKAMFIKDGNIKYLGNTAQVASLYREQNADDDNGVTVKAKDMTLTNKSVKIDAKLRNKPSDPELLFDISITPKIDIPGAVIAISLAKDSGEIVYRWASNEKIPEDVVIKSGKKVAVELKIQNIFPNGEFSLNIGLRNKDMTKFYVSADEVIKFRVINKSNYAADMYWKPSERAEISQ